MNRIADIYRQLGALPGKLVLSVSAVILCSAAAVLFALNSRQKDKAAADAQGYSAYLPAVDGLRAVSAIMIFSFHLWQQTWIAYRLRLTDKIWLFNFEPLQRYGYVVLDAFYVLSGFCLFYPVAREMFGECGRQSLKTFYIKRARRILPAYLITLLLVLIFPAAGPRIDRNQPMVELIKYYLSQLFFMHNFSNTTINALVPTAWTMAIEVQFYIMFPFIAAVFRKKPYLTTLLMAVIGYAARMLLIAYFPMSQVIQGNTLGYFDIFAFGMLAAYIVVKMRHSSVDWDRLRALMTVIAVLCLAAAYHFMLFMGSARIAEGAGDSYARFCYRLIPGVMFAGFLISASYSMKFFEKGICGNRFFVFMSGISYSFYLVQQNVNILLKHLGIPYASENPVMNDRNAMEGFTLIAISVCLIYSVIVTKYIEKPICKYGFKGCIMRLASKKERRKEAAI